jgi:hypothetical protein
MVGWALALVGVVIVVVGGLADQMGLGGEGEDQFGGRQVIAMVVGVVVLAVGLVLALVVGRGADSTG